MWRAGLVSFGQALYYCIGAYAVALVGRTTGVTDAFLLMLIGGACAGLVAFVVGFLLARYREIFFAMLSLALSMILYGVLVKAESLGSTVPAELVSTAATRSTRRPSVSDGPSQAIP